MLCFIQFYNFMILIINTILIDCNINISLMCKTFLCLKLKYFYIESNFNEVIKSTMQFNKLRTKEKHYTRFITLNETSTFCTSFFLSVTQAFPPAGLRVFQTDSLKKPNSQIVKLFSTVFSCMEMLFVEIMSLNL